MAEFTAEEPLMLVYEHKANCRNIVPHGVYPMSELDLMIALSAHSDCTISTKSIKPGELYIDIYKADLQNEDIKKQLGDQEPPKNECPWKLYLGPEYKGHGYTELKIVTPILVAMGGREMSDEERKAEAEANAGKKG